MDKKILIPTVLALLVFAIGVGWFNSAIEKKSSTRNTANEKGEVVNKVALQIDEHSTKIPLEELLQGCLSGKDCIPSIDEPEFQSLEKANDWLKSSDRVFVFSLNGETRIYPQRILNWHEIVNDWFPDENGEHVEPIAVTFCPLCGTAVAFERKVDGVITEFGVSGKLHNSDLVMYDRFEGSLWQQITGEAIVGPAASRNEILQPRLLMTLEWSQALERFPDAVVLSRNTGFERDYDHYPYGNYEENAQIFFPVQNQDDRLDPKDWVYGIVVNNQAKAYPEKILQRQKEAIDSLGGKTFQITLENGAASFKDSQSGEDIVPLRSFWFAWVAFYPETDLYP